MDFSYFNFELIPAVSRWDQMRFWGTWRGFAREDNRWIPPYYPALRSALFHQPDHRFYVMEAMRRQERELQMQPGMVSPMSTPAWPVQVAAAILLPVPGRPQAAYLSSLHCANNEEVLARFLDLIAENSGYQQLIGPTGPVPHLFGGAAGSHWHEQSPLHTPYSPPFLIELLHNVMKPAGASRLYWALVSPEQPNRTATQPAGLVPLALHALSGELYPLLQAAFQNAPAGVPTQEESITLINFLDLFPSFGRLAVVDGEPVGFFLLQPDLAEKVKRSGGGRFFWQQAWFRRAQHRPVAAGRLLFGAVLPHFRGRGIGRQLWQAALQTGREQGWRQISIGPVGENQPGNRFLHMNEAKPHRHYTLFSWNASSGGGIWW